MSDDTTTHEIHSADQVLDARRELARMNYGQMLPTATVLAEEDWLRYVQAMAETVPAGETIAFPTEAEVSWSWPDGVLILFETPLNVQHSILSREGRDGRIERVPDRSEQQLAQGLALVPQTEATVVDADGKRAEIQAIGLIWIGADPTDLITGFWLPGSLMQAGELGVISQSSRLLVSIITALGHRLTRVGPPVTAGRGERRRVQRELPELRVLSLGSRDKPTRAEEPTSVNWTHRWLVRGHWRQQPHGFNRKLRRLKWIDPYVKGPEDKPLDIRPTVWRTGPPE